MTQAAANQSGCIVAEPPGKVLPGECEPVSVLPKFQSVMLPAQFQVIVTRHPEYACRSCEDPQAWLADTLACIPGCKISRVNDLLPWKHRPKSR